MERSLLCSFLLFYNLGIHATTYNSQPTPFFWTIPLEMGCCINWINFCSNRVACLLLLKESNFSSYGRWFWCLENAASCKTYNAISISHSCENKWSITFRGAHFAANLGLLIRSLTILRFSHSFEMAFSSYILLYLCF